MENLKFNIITIILIFSFVYPILKGFLFKFSSDNVKRDINSILSNISFIFALFFGIYFSKKFFIEHDYGIYLTVYKIIPPFVTDFLKSNPIYNYIIVIPIVTFIMYNIIFGILFGVSMILLYPIADIIENSLRERSDFFKRLTGAVFQLPRSICYVLLVTLLINMFSIFNNNKDINKEIEQSQTYNVICQQIVIPLVNSNIARQLPAIIDNSFKIEIRQGNSQNGKSGSILEPIIYYNGITLDEGVKSNSKIDSFARNLTEGQTNIKLKSKLIYNWVGNNIDYNENKATSVLNDNFSEPSGAIAAFDTRKGICFDYACLYTAMCRANGIKVRFITGEGFNGVSWVSHAWNQVYIPEESKWINVDTTFYKGGNYFDSARFSIDHKNAKTAGEW